MNPGERRLRNLLLRGLGRDTPAYHAFLQELSAHLRAFLRKRLARLSRPGLRLAWIPGALPAPALAMWTLAGFVLMYCLHCPELEAPFLGFRHLLGILIPTAAGALLGPRLLRW